MKRICVYAGSNPGQKESYIRIARQLGASLAERDIGIVYGAGKSGVMGALAEGALTAGGTVIGVVPEFMIPHDSIHQSLTELRVIRTMHERKTIMAELADGFIALPGGIGTLEELCEILAWAQLGLHDKPCGLLNVSGYYDRFLAFLDDAVNEQFFHARHRNYLRVETDPEALIAAFESMWK